MKKFIVPIILAAVLGVGGGVTAVMLNKGTVANANMNEDDVPTNVELKSGNYYLNGDKNSDLWVVVTPDFLILKGKDVDASIRRAITERALPNEAIELEISEAKILYCTEKKYILQSFIPEKSKYAIRVSRDNKHTDRESLEKSNASFIFNCAENSIHLSLFGDFILVED